MNRMHTEDLRANIAMKFVELHAKACQCNASYSEMIEKADNFIAELKRTAKPEPDTKDAAAIALDDIANVCDHPRWEYPGQVTRYVIELKARLRNAMTFVVTAEARVKDLEADIELAKDVDYMRELNKAQTCIIEERDQLQARVRELEHVNGVFAQTVDALVARCENAEARVKELEAENPTLQIKYQYVKDLREKLKLRPEESLTHAVACEHNKLNEAVELLKEIRCELDDLPLDKEGYQRYCKIIRFLKTIPS